MGLDEILKSKSIKENERTEILVELITEKSKVLESIYNNLDELPEKTIASVIEAIEKANKTANIDLEERWFDFALIKLKSSSSRLVWESAQLIGNLIHNFPNRAIEAFESLLTLSTHSGTVVRWSAAFAISEIAPYIESNKQFWRNKLETAMTQESKRSILKHYINALHKIRA